jgi:hypothetical protein
MSRRSDRKIARDTYRLACAVPEVLLHRTARMWLAGPAPSRRDRAELHRMSAEKVAAFYESWNAMALEMIRANTQLTSSCLWWPWSGVFAAGLAPIRRRAVANAKRLRRLRA